MSEVLRITLKRRPFSLNTVISANRFKNNATFDDWKRAASVEWLAEKMVIEYGHEPMVFPYKGSFNVDFYAYSKNGPLMDTDNLVATEKPMLDAALPATEKNTMGVGILQSDSSKQYKSLVVYRHMRPSDTMVENVGAEDFVIMKLTLLEV